MFNVIYVVFLLWASTCFAEQWGVISVPVSDIRTQPIAITEFKLPILPPYRYEGKPLYGCETLYSQGLFGERVDIQCEQDGWLYITAREQSEYVQSQWRYLSGWVRQEHITTTSDIPAQYNIIVTAAGARVYDLEMKNVLLILSMGSRLRLIQQTESLLLVELPDGRRAYVTRNDACVISDLVSESDDELRKQIVNQAKKFLHCPYTWDGRSFWNGQWESHDKNTQITSVDCSGLTNMAYRACGLTIPRMSYDQYAASNQEILKTGNDLKSGDLIFLADPAFSPPKIRHVILFLGEDLIIESQGLLEPYGVRIVTCKDYERFGGLRFADIKNGQRILYVTPEKTQKDTIVYFGSYLHSRESIQKLRDAFLNLTLPERDK